MACRIRVGAELLAVLLETGVGIPSATSFNIATKSLKGFSFAASSAFLFSAAARFFAARGDSGLLVFGAGAVVVAAVVASVVLAAVAASVVVAAGVASIVVAAVAASAEDVSTLAGAGLGPPVWGSKFMRSESALAWAVSA